MGAIEQIATAEAFQPGSVYGNTAKYRSVKRDLLDIADRLQALVGNMGIEGGAAGAIDQSLIELVDRLRERGDNVDQLADARNTATQGGNTAGNASVTIQDNARQARDMITSDDPATQTRGEMWYQRIERDASTALQILDSQTAQAITELPTIFPADSPVSDGTGSQVNASRSSQSGISDQASSYAARPNQSATRWMPEVTVGETSQVGPGSRATIGTGPGAINQPSVNLGFEVSQSEPGAVSEEVGQPVREGFPTTNEGYAVRPATGAVNVPFTSSTPTENNGFGVGIAKAAAGAAALPAMSKAVARARAAMGATPRGAGAAPRGSSATTRGATARGGVTPRASGAPVARGGAQVRGGAGSPVARGAGAPPARSGAAARATPTSRGGIAPRAGQGAATRAGTPARGASARTSGQATARGAAGARGGAGARGATPARGATAARSASTGTTARRATTAGNGTARSGMSGARGGVTAPRQGAQRAASGRGMMGRGVTGRAKKKDRNDQQPSIETFAASEMVEDTTVTFIESGHRDDD